MRIGTSPYSRLNTSIGSIRDARTAGAAEASSAEPASTSVAIAKVGGSRESTPSNSDDTTRLERNDSANPATAATAMSCTVSRMNIRTTCLDEAPSAMRTPISRVRSAAAGSHRDAARERRSSQHPRRVADVLQERGHDLSRLFAVGSVYRGEIAQMRTSARSPVPDFRQRAAYRIQRVNRTCAPSAVCPLRGFMAPSFARTIFRKYCDSRLLATDCSREWSRVACTTFWRRPPVSAVARVQTASLFVSDASTAPSTDTTHSVAPDCRTASPTAFGCKEVPSAVPIPMQTMARRGAGLSPTLLAAVTTPSSMALPVEVPEAMTLIPASRSARFDVKSLTGTAAFGTC